MELIKQHLYHLLVAAVLFMLALGTAVYHFLERWSWLDSYYFCVVTLATVGYGDLAPHTPTGKLFTTFYILVGVGLFTTFLSALVQHRGKRYAARHTPPDKKLD